MLRQVAEGVLVHESEFLQSNAVVLLGPAGVLVIDPGVREPEVVALADALLELGHPVVAGFSTHPHWDHVLWHERLGAAPRYGTAGAAEAMAALLSDAGWTDRLARVVPPDVLRELPLDGFGRITGLSPGATEVPWDGPRVRVIEHRGHAQGHAALLVEEPRVLIAGDMLSDTLIPILDAGAADSIADSLAALGRLEAAADDADVVVPGHGSVGDRDEVRARIDRDRAYLLALREGRGDDDPRLAPSAVHGAWLPGVHARQVPDR